MKDQFFEPKHGFLPNVFRRIGIAVIVGVLVSIVTFKLLPGQFKLVNKELLRIFLLNTFILGLLLVVWARDKVEDEMTFAIRFKVLGMTMINGVLLLLIAPIIQLLFKEPVTGIGSQQLVVSMLLFYLLMYFVQKRAR